MNNTKILFIVKRRNFYGNYDIPQRGLSEIPHITRGLYNSAAFVVQMLLQNGVHAKIVEVIDNNDIDKEVHNFKPTYVIIEGLWVVPDKFTILTKLHPTITWIVRLHSEVPFLAMEGIAIDWILKYLLYDKVLVSANSPAALDDLRKLMPTYHPDWNNCKIEEKLLLLPNYYPTTAKPEMVVKQNQDRVLNIASFGAVRPLKNQLSQAMAAIIYATKHNHILNFHMNGSRLEQGGSNNFKNIESLFIGTPHKLITHSWIPHNEFVKLVRTMDLSMCVSFSETFCIVAADSVNERVPLVASKEIKWCSAFNQADPTNLESIITTIERVLNPMTKKLFISINHEKLVEYCENTVDIWCKYFKRWQ